MSVSVFSTWKWEESHPSQQPADKSMKYALTQIITSISQPASQSVRQLFRVAFHSFCILHSHNFIFDLKSIRMNKYCLYVEQTCKRMWISWKSIHSIYPRHGTCELHSFDHTDTLKHHWLLVSLSHVTLKSQTEDDAPPPHEWMCWLQMRGVEDEIQLSVMGMSAVNWFRQADTVWLEIP